MPPPHTFFVSVHHETHQMSKMGNKKGNACDGSRLTYALEVFPWEFTGICPKCEFHVRTYVKIANDVYEQDSKSIGIGIK